MSNLLVFENYERYFFKKIRKDYAFLGPAIEGKGTREATSF